MYYLSSENKGADQLRSYCEADLRLCFRMGKNPVFSGCGSYYMEQEIPGSKPKYGVFVHYHIPAYFLVKCEFTLFYHYFQISVGWKSSIHYFG